MGTVGHPNHIQRVVQLSSKFSWHLRIALALIRSVQFGQSEQGRRKGSSWHRTI